MSAELVKLVKEARGRVQQVAHALGEAQELDTSALEDLLSELVLLEDDVGEAADGVVERLQE